MNGFLQDLRYAVRQLRKSPGFATVAIVTLALGIGANTAIFSLLDQALLRSLPVKDVDRLVILKYAGGNIPGRLQSRTDGKFYFSYPMYRDLRDRNSVLSGLIATDWTQVGVQWHNQPDLVAAELVSGNYFDVLGLQPALGRLFVPSDDLKPDANPVVVLSFSYWQRRFGADPGILNQSILVNGNPFTVVGVAPPGFHSVVMGDTPDVFTPMMMQSEIMPGRKDLDNHHSSWLNIIGKLRPGISRTQAEAGIAPLWYAVRSDELKDITGESEGFRDLFLTKSHLLVLDGARGFSPLRSDVRMMPLLIVMGMVALVALMACANVGSLLLVRASGRIREMSVRYALGAKRKRVIQQLLVEGLLLGSAGGLLGILLAPRVSALLINMIWSGGTSDLPFSAKPDLRIMLFNFALALFASLLFSLAPAAQFWRPDLAPALKQQGMTARSSPLRFRRISVALQIGLSLMLMVGAGLFVRTLHNLRSLNAGFTTDHLLTFGIDPRMAGYEPARTFALYRSVFETLSGLPGVRSVGATNDPELANDNESGNIAIAGYTEKPHEDMNVEQPNVSPDYFSTLQMPLLAGRAFTAQDSGESQKVAVVNESFARRFFGDPQKALGRFVGYGGRAPKTDTAIIGVVKDAKHASLREPVTRTLFRPYLQISEPQAMTFYVRTWQQPESAESTIRRAMQAVDSNLVLDTFRTMDEQIDNNLTAERVIALLASGFGVLAALMAAVGLYGVLAYSTTQRTSEIGIRMALGATRASVVKMVLVEVLWLAGISIAVALPVSLLLMYAVRSQLYGISGSDPLTLCGMTLLVTLVALASAMLPARRAARVEPMNALRYE